MTIQQSAGVAEITVAPPRLRPRRSGIVGSRRSTVVLAVAPACAAIALFLVLPLVQGVRLSLSSWGGVGPLSWVGTANYRAALTSSFASSLWLTTKFAVLSAVGIIVLATLMAAVVSGGVGGAPFYRVVWFLPGIAPIAAVAVFWSASFQPNQGAVNVIMGHLGLGYSHSWLASSTQAIYPPIFVTIWASVGFAFLLMLGSMEQIPVTLYEAARIDGAGRVTAFFSITLPLVRPVLSVTALLELIWSFNGFTTIWAMTQGGPGFATSTLPVLIYKQAFQQTDFGLASAMAIIGGVILVIVGIISLRFSQSRQQEVTR